MHIYVLYYVLNMFNFVFYFYFYYFISKSVVFPLGGWL